MKIKAKIIGNQIWTTEDVTVIQLKNLLRTNLHFNHIAIPVKNDVEKWNNYNGPACCSYQSNVHNKQSFLFNRSAADMTFGILRGAEAGWRLPTIEDWILLFQYIDPKHNYDYWSDSIAINLRSTYGWPNNGTNKIGFNAIPNYMRNEDGSYNNEPFAQWWIYNNQRQGAVFGGISLYPNDVIAEFGTNANIGLAIRLVRDLVDPRPEDNIVYM